MSLHSPIFIFLFLPIVLLIFWGLFFTSKGRFYWLIAASLIFYLWYNPDSALFLLVWSLIVFLAGAYLQQHRDNKFALTAALTILSTVFILFKLMDAEVIPAEASLAVGIRKITGNPVGFSFLALIQAAYLIDTAKNRLPEFPNLWQHTLYLTFFGKILAGPVTRFQKISEKLSLSPTIEDTAAGLRRFALGFIKKALVADILGQATAQIGDLPVRYLSFSTAWIGLLFFSLQIYYDFSGYTDMAIGLGQVFGIHLPENFDYPYIAKSISEFWRRWHISFSNWFRDYIFFPLERFRRTHPNWKQTYSVLVVFLLTGLWHGITPNYILWGLLHSTTISMENAFLSQSPDQEQTILKHFYTKLVIIVGWVFFLTGSLRDAIAYLGALFRPGVWYISVPVERLKPIEPFEWIVFICGLVFSIPWVQVFQHWRSERPIHTVPTPITAAVWQGYKDVLLLAMFSFATAMQFEFTLSSFIYGGF